MFGHLSSQETARILSDNIFGRIGFTDGIQPYILPISYTFHDNNIYCHTRNGFKINVMRKHPAVCFEVEEISDMANWKTVVCSGNFEEISEPEQRNEALTYLTDRLLPIVSSETTHLFPNWPFAPANLNEIKGVVFRINILNSTGRFERYDKYEKMPV